MLWAKLSTKGDRLRSRLARILVSVSVLLALGMMFAPAVGATRAPRYVECSSTVWATYSERGTTIVPVTVLAYTQILEDAHDFSYCGGVRDETAFSQTDGGCRWFDATVVDGNGVNHGTNSGYFCATGGNLYSGSWGPASGQCAHGQGWTTDSPHTAIGAGAYCP